jgi:molybdate transport system substrate-binding protein
VYAASSVNDAIEEIALAQAGGTDTAMVVNSAASSVLAQQIQAGAPAHVFVSANAEWADALGGLAEARTELLGNSLVVVAPADSALELADLAALAAAEFERAAIADPSHVPAGRYARDALESAGVWDGLTERVVLGHDARSALLLVETGAADVGVVYATDAKRSSQVRVVLEVDPGLHDPIRYPVLLLSAAREDRAFFDALRSPESRAIWERHGFTVLPE